MSFKRPVMVGDVRYESVSEVAQMINRRPCRVCTMIKRGTPLPDGRKIKYAGTCVGKCVEVLENGKVVKTYPTVTEFAHSLNVSVAYACDYLNKKFNCRYPAIEEQMKGKEARFKK